jgi:hypothetical protein
MTTIINFNQSELTGNTLIISGIDIPSRLNSAHSQANTATTNAATADQKAVSAGSYANSAYAHANTKFSSSGGTISGDLTVSGNLSVLGNVTSYSSQDLIIDDPIILLANNNNGNSIDVGFTAHYVEGGNTKHTGLIKDVSANTWYLFDNYGPHVQDNNLIDPNDSTFRFANLTANLVTSVAFIRGYDPINHANASYAQANTGTILAQAAFDSANNVGPQVQPAFNAANSAGSFANSAYTQANTATTNAATADQKAVSAGSYANSAYTQANTATTNAATADQRAVTSGVYANSAYQTANSAGSYANSAFARANTSLVNNGATSTTGILFAAGLVSNTSVTMNTSAVVSSTAQTTASTSQVSIDSFASATFRTAKYLAQITSGSAFHVIELLLIHDGTTVYLSQYAEILSGASLGTFDATITTGTLNLLFTPTNSATTVKLHKTLIAV